MDVLRLSWVNHEDLVPNTVVEGDAPDYEEKKNDVELSYIEKILALTEETNTTEKNISSNTNSNGSIETHKNNDSSNVEESQEEFVETPTIGNDNKNSIKNHEKGELSVDHSKLIQSQFPWIVEKDYGSFKLVHYDRPIPLKRIACILDSVLEGEDTTDEFILPTTNLTEQSYCNEHQPTSNKQEKGFKDLVKSSTESCKSLPAIHIPGIAGRNCSKMNKMKMKFQSVHNNTDLNTKTDLQNKKNKTIHGGQNGTPCSRPDSQLSDAPMSSGVKENVPENIKSNKMIHQQVQNDKSEVINFKPGRVKQTIKKTFDEILNDNELKYEDIKQNTELLCDLIKTKLKPSYSPRYRLICTVNVMETKKQSAEFASQCCWDREKDNVVEYFFERADCIVSCVVYGVYKE